MKRFSGTSCARHEQYRNDSSGSCYRRFLCHFDNKTAETLASARCPPTATATNLIQARYLVQVQCHATSVLQLVQTDRGFDEKMGPWMFDPAASFLPFLPFLSFHSDGATSRKSFRARGLFGCASFRRLKATASKKFAATEGRKGLGERRGKNERELVGGCKESCSEQQCLHSRTRSMIPGNQATNIFPFLFVFTFPPSGGRLFVR